MITEETSLSKEAEQSVVQAITAIKAGRMVILVDDEDRENEGDFAMAAEDATPVAVNFMTQVGRGLICVPMLGKDLDRLKIPMMVQNNSAPLKTAFTVSVDAAEGVTTGISVADRSATISLLADKHSRPEQLTIPGHIFPLRYQPGGVLVRAGQTEGSIDLVTLSGKKPTAVICEILNEDGTMARHPQLTEIAERYSIPIVSVANIIAWRLSVETIVTQAAIAKLPTKFGEFKVAVYKNKFDQVEHLALIKGHISPDENTLVRVHSECLTGDVFGSTRCECGEQAELALRAIDREGKGVFVYMRQEGRGIGLLNKIKAYDLQDQGHDTVEANTKLGFPMDLRHYGIGAQILHDLGVRHFRLLTNNPKKIAGLQGFGLELTEVVPITAQAKDENRKYLRTKRDKMGHLLASDI